MHNDYKTSWGEGGFEGLHPFLLKCNVITKNTTIYAFHTGEFHISQASTNAPENKEQT